MNKPTIAIICSLGFGILGLVSGAHLGKTQGAKSALQEAVIILGTQESGETFGYTNYLGYNQYVDVDTAGFYPTLKAENAIALIASYQVAIDPYQTDDKGYPITYIMYGKDAEGAQLAIQVQSRFIEHK